MNLRHLVLKMNLERHEPRDKPAFIDSKEPRLKQRAAIVKLRLRAIAIHAK